VIVTDVEAFLTRIGGHRNSARKSAEAAPPRALPRLAFAEGSMRAEGSRARARFRLRSTWRLSLRIASIDDTGALLRGPSPDCRRPRPLRVLELRAVR